MHTTDVELDRRFARAAQARNTRSRIVKTVMFAAAVAVTVGTITVGEGPAAPAVAQPVTITLAPVQGSVAPAVGAAGSLPVTGVKAPTAKKKAAKKKAAKKKAAKKKKVNWFAEARAILNKVGGKHVKLVKYNGNCSGHRVVACTSFKGTTVTHIAISSGFAKWSKARKVWALTHELAHTYQVKIMPKLKAAPNFKKLFGSNLETLANCMASVKGKTNHGTRCTSTMLKAAAKVWKGQTP